MKRMRKLLLMPCLLALLVSGCATSGGPSNNYPGLGCIGAVRLTDEIIDRLDDEAVKRILEHNEREERRGCAIPNS